MSALSDLIGDSDTIGRMTDQEFDHYWKALGTVVRLACQAKPEPEKAVPQSARKELA